MSLGPRACALDTRSTGNGDASEDLAMLRVIATAPSATRPQIHDQAHFMPQRTTLGETLQRQLLSEPPCCSVDRRAAQWTALLTLTESWKNGTALASSARSKLSRVRGLGKK